MSLAREQIILELDNISFSYERQGRFIEDLSLSVGQGEFIGLLGANGSGKSTILKLACGIIKPWVGDVMLWSRRLGSYNDRDRAKLISYLPQSLDPATPFTVLELVSMGLYPYDIPPDMTAEAALVLTGLSEKKGAFISELSGGEKRRAHIAMTLLQGAGLLLMDEPLANLDIKYQSDLVKLLRRLNSERNMSVVMALHDINMAFQFDRLILVKDGRILGSGPPPEVLTTVNIKEAFDVTVDIIEHEKGRFYASMPEEFLE